MSFIIPTSLFVRSRGELKDVGIKGEALFTILISPFIRLIEELEDISIKIEALYTYLFHLSVRH